MLNPNRSALTVSIVGAGFSGTATMIHLIRAAHDRSIRIMLIERGPEFGRGLAYSRSRYPYLLNVPAFRMSATTSDPDEFLRFARTRHPEATGEEFLPRSLYGDYLQDLLETEIMRAPETVQIDRVRGEIVDLMGVDDGAATLRFADGRRLKADVVVLALGTPLPRLSLISDGNIKWPALRRTPWSEGKSLTSGEKLLVIGTSLTMIDVVSAALDCQPQAEIHAVSRHGLVPPSQTAFRPDALKAGDTLFESPLTSIAGLVAIARQLAREAEHCGGDWREVVTLLRRHAPALWANLPIVERRRFLRHVRAYWDIHRHRAPGAVLKRIEQARAAGRLFVHAGRLRSLAATEEGVRATWTDRDSREHRTLEFGEVVDCSGPDYDLTRTSDALWHALLEKGLAMPDDLRLGVRTGLRGALVRRDGSLCTKLYYVGPMLRADHWEATAVGELRTHAEQLAFHLSSL